MGEAIPRARGCQRAAAPHFLREVEHFFTTRKDLEARRVHGLYPVARSSWRRWWSMWIATKRMALMGSTFPK